MRRWLIVGVYNYNNVVYYFFVIDVLFYVVDEMNIVVGIMVVDYSFVMIKDVNIKIEGVVFVCYIVVIVVK